VRHDREGTAGTNRDSQAVARLRRIGEAAEARLRSANYVELRAVSCEFRQGVLTLRGKVPSYYLKQMAQSLVDGVPGVVELDNQLEVDGRRPRGGRPSPLLHHEAPARRRPR
jgi:osmotically-inducible protein OsmY